MPEVTSHPAGTPSWVDLMTPSPADDSAFYNELFGWTYEPPVDPELTGGYGMFKLKGKNVAGVGPMMGEGAPPMWSTYIATDDAAATAEKVTAAGGSVMVPPMQVLDAGHMAVFADSTGAVFGVWQPLAHTGAELINETGTLVWNELNTRDVEASKAFYAAVFGWTAAASDENYSVFSLDGKEVGGLMSMDSIHLPPEVPAHWGVYFAVEDVDAAVAKIKELGGDTFTQPFDTPGGRMCVVRDAVGAFFNIIAMPGQLRG